MKNKPINLLFDVSPLANSKKSGVGFYTERLLHALATKYPEDLHITGHYFNFLNKKSAVLPEYPNVVYRKTSLFPSKVINIMRRFNVEPPIESLVPQKHDFILYPNFAGYPSIRKTPSASVVHDLCYLDTPEYVQAANRRFLTKFVPKTIKRSVFTVAVSETTKQAIVKKYRADAKKIVVTPIPPPQTTFEPKAIETIPSKFILFLGTLEPRKNFISLVRAYMQLPQAMRKEYSLVLAGGTGWYVEEALKEIRVLQDAGENIIVTGYFSDNEKAWLFSNASLFVQPSHYEGFGMPILEAMDAKVPTVVSGIPIFHEVSGDASLFFDQNDPSAIAASMKKVLTNKSFAKDLVIKGQKQVQKLDWDTIAEQLYQRILASVR